MSDETSHATAEDSGAGLGKSSEIPEESVASESDLALDKVAEALQDKNE